MKLIGGTYVYNEELMIPYVMPYVERMGYDKFIVFDDGCTDGTIEKLKEYPFVEIRKGKKTEIDVVNDRKLKAMLDLYAECLSLSHKNDNEDVWMTWTDFDEVIFLQRERGSTLREYLELMNERGYNFFDGRMIHLVWDGKERGDWLPHTWNGVRGAWWLTEGKKVTMLKVNDTLKIYGFYGNHDMGVKFKDGVHPRNLEGCMEFNGFHMKYFDPETLKSKDGDKIFVDSAVDANRVVREASFPLEDYFLMKGFFAEKSLPNKRDYGEGIFLLK